VATSKFADLLLKHCRHKCGIVAKRHPATFFCIIQQEENLRASKEAFHLDMRVGPSCADLQWLAVDITKRGLLGWSSWAKYNKRLESFALMLFTVSSTCGFKKKTYFSLGLKILTKKSAKDRKCRIYS
jgi:hypothetical protein